MYLMDGNMKSCYKVIESTNKFIINNVNKYFSFCNSDILRKFTLITSRIAQTQRVTVVSSSGFQYINCEIDWSYWIMFKQLMCSYLIEHYHWMLKMTICESENYKIHKDGGKEIHIYIYTPEKKVCLELL